MKTVGLRASAAILLALVVLAASGGIVGCATTEQAEESVEPAVNPDMDNGGDPNVQICAYCSGTALPDSEATAQIVDGKQIVRTSIEKGSYAPNIITASAGTPITLEFAPAQPAKGCIARPTIETLSKQANVPESMGALDLGVVEPGEYPITCGMGTAAGLLIVK